MQLPPDTERLRFRPFVEADAQVLFDILNDDYARKFYPDASMDLAHRWEKKNFERYQQDGFGLWVVELKSTGEAIGDCGLTYQQVDSSTELEVGYHMHSGHRRCGYASEAAKACLDFGFQITDADKIVSLVHKDNIASRGVAEKLHDHRDETIRKNMPHWVFYTVREEHAA